MNKPQNTRSFMFLDPSIGSSDNIWLLKNSVNLTKSKAIGLGELLEIYMSFEVRLGI